MLCRVDPLAVESKSRCMRRDQSRRIPQEEAVFITRCLLPSGNWIGKNNALSGYDGTDQEVFIAWRGEDQIESSIDR